MKVRVLDEVVPAPGRASPALEWVILLATQRLIRLVAERPEGDGLSARLRSWLGPQRAAQLRPFFVTRPRSYGFSREVDLVAGASDFDANPILIGPEDVEWLRLPVRLYLENGRNDWGFVNKGIPLSLRGAFTESCRRVLVEPEGGTGLPELLEIVKHHHQHDARLRRRSWFLFDSDGPPGRPSPKAAALRDLLTELRIPFHMLQRRAIENYVPRKQRQEWVFRDRPVVVEREAWMGAFDALSDMDRWAFPMKQGDPNYPPPLDGGLPPGDSRRAKGTSPLSAVWLDAAWPVPERDLDTDGSKPERAKIACGILGMVA